MSGRDFRDIQRTFADHLRDPAQAPPPGIEERRLAVYRALFFNNVDNFLRGFFPVLHSLYSEADWLALARAFYAGHRARSPYFLEIAEEFLAWLDSGEFAPRACDPPYLRQLAHYEWLELALDVAVEELATVDHDPAGDLLAGVPVASPVAVLARYDWPVHRVTADAVVLAPAETFLMVYRDRDDAVRFLEVNAVTARLFARVGANAEGHSGRELALQVAAEIGHPDPEVVVAGAAGILQMLRERDIIPGTRPR